MEHRHVAVLGAGGRTGGEVVRQAGARGLGATAVARRPLPGLASGEQLRTAVADVTDPDALSIAVRGCDAVICAIGTGTSRAPTRLYSDGVARVLEAMARTGARRLVVVSAAPAAPREQQPRLERRVLMPILDRVFGETYTDMRRMEALLATSEIDWTVLRPPRLSGRPGRGDYRLNAEGALRGARSITCADLATALLDALDSPELHRRAAAVAGPS